MHPWQRLVGTRTEPRRVPNPGVVFLALTLAVGWLCLALSALRDERTVQGAVGVGLAVVSAGWGLATLRDRRRTNEQVARKTTRKERSR